MVKHPHLEMANAVFVDTGINITDEGRKHLGAVIGTDNFKTLYVNEQIDIWINELTKLSDIAKVEPHAAYSAFTHGYRHKFTYVMRTVDGVSNLFTRLDRDIDKLIRNLFFGHELSEEERKIVPLPVRMGGGGGGGVLEMIIPSEICETQFKNSESITPPLSNAIIEQRELTKEDKAGTKERKTEVKRNTERANQDKLKEIKDKLSNERLRILEQVSEPPVG